MCGIVGVVSAKNGALARDVLNKLLLDSQTRGKDSSGIARVTPSSIVILKEKTPAEVLVRGRQYRQLLKDGAPDFVAIAHTRMETNGTFDCNFNNQPVVKSGVVAIHNGIIVNDRKIWTEHPELVREYEVDTEVLCALIGGYLASSMHPIEAFAVAAAEVEGSYSVGLLFDKWNGLLLATNNGSLYCLDVPARGLFCFASEQNILERTRRRFFRARCGKSEIVQVRATTGRWIQFHDRHQVRFDVQAGRPPRATATSGSSDKVSRTIVSLESEKMTVTSPKRAAATNRQQVEHLVSTEYARVRDVVERLRRCTRCILPETMPFIRFDENGVCNYCHRHQARETRGLPALHQAVSPYRRGNGEADCIVSFSGGRDSSFALHYVKKELGLNPIAYSYDWGMLTDLGRRNQARMTGALGVEHLLVSADIQRKRSYVRQNLEAWARRPSLGIIPLFMAGDKQYFYHLNRTREKTGIKLVIYADNSLEKTDFKYGFAGVRLNSDVGKAYAIGRLASLRLLFFYGKEYVSNPKYFNTSLFDTFTAYLSSYVVPKEYLYLFRFILWDEKTVEQTLVDGYGWELAEDTRSSWRIGDGTQAFYNYAYFIASGLTEHDTFRSNQIREGAIDRASALEQARAGNAPRSESLLWYFDTIGVDGVAMVRAINAMPKQWG